MPIITKFDLLKKRRIKIIATIGPASENPVMIKALINAGVDVFRLNMSHGDHDFHRKMYCSIRQIATEQKRNIAVLVDLCGPKIRIGNLQGGKVRLQTGHQIAITTRDIIGTQEVIPSRYQRLADDVTVKDRILLDDGNLELLVEQVRDSEIICRVICGGILQNNKGINLPGVEVSAPSLTSKDKEDVHFAMQLGVDFLALSFVRCAADVQMLRELVDTYDKDIEIIAKIEKPEALKDIDKILELSDGIMIARGDLGVELNLEQVPVAQHQLIDRARYKFKPVIVATQMLESMIDNARPTRAEVNDISNAVTSGADAIMLSGETAVGAYSVAAVSMMDRVARQTETYLWQKGDYVIKPHGGNVRSMWQAMADVAARLAHDLHVHAIFVVSKSGMSVATISSVRPAAPVIAITYSAAVCRKMALLWSVIPIQSSKMGQANPSQLACQIAVEQDLASPGDKILLIRGFHQDPKLNTPSIAIITI